MKRRRRAVADESGTTTTQVAVLFPALLMLVMLTVQYGLWFHAKQVANAAAAEATDAAQTPDGTEAAGEAAARSFLDAAGNLDAVTVSVRRGVTDVVVDVAGRAPNLVPGFAWGVRARAVAPVERFVPEVDR